MSPVKCDDLNGLRGEGIPPLPPFEIFFLCYEYNRASHMTALMREAPPLQTPLLSEILSPEMWFKLSKPINANRCVIATYNDDFCFN